MGQLLVLLGELRHRDLGREVGGAVQLVRGRGGGSEVRSPGPEPPLLSSPHVLTTPECPLWAPSRSLPGSASGVTSSREPVLIDPPPRALPLAAFLTVHGSLTKPSVSATSVPGPPLTPGSCPFREWENARGIVKGNGEVVNRQSGEGWLSFHQGAGSSGREGGVGAGGGGEAVGWMGAGQGAWPAQRQVGQPFVGLLSEWPSPYQAYCVPGYVPAPVVGGPGIQ